MAALYDSQASGRDSFLHSSLTLPKTIHKRQNKTLPDERKRSFWFKGASSNDLHPDPELRRDAQPS